MVSVDNISDNDFLIEKGSRLFQICGPTLSSITFELADTHYLKLVVVKRGFGSTN